MEVIRGLRDAVELGEERVALRLLRLLYQDEPAEVDDATGGAWLPAA